MNTSHRAGSSRYSNLLTTSNRWDDGQAIAIFGDGVHAFEESDVFIIDEEVDESAWLTGFIKEAIFECRELANDISEHRLNSGAGCFDSVLTFGLRTERGGDLDFDGHVLTVVG